MRRSERRAQLIIIARKLFAEQGYSSISIEEIASAAHVSKPVVYEHFGSKEGIYQVIVDRELTHLRAMLEENIQVDEHPRAILEKT
ncbi:MAG: helix-turn-helix transcriptional regulator, partial [Actinomycetaceae bacterium]|nr:helix-turn-helix transcriptional regulator [Actinomycetaceae bacterium]